jgi:YbbR domain-containing protein
MMRVLAHNWLPKLISLALAIVAWYFILVSDASVSQRNLDVPVTVVGLEQNQIISGGITDKVNIMVSGDSRQIDRLRPENFDATLNVAGLKGNYEHKIDVIAPQGISVDSISPEISIGKIETIGSKTVPVVIAFLPGQDTNTVFQTNAKVQDIVVQGRESVLEQITQATAVVAPQAGEFEVTFVGTNITGQPIANALDITLEPPSGLVTVIATAVLHTKVIPLVVQEPVLNGYRILDFKLSSPTITLAGPQGVLEPLESIQGSVVLADTLEAGTYDLPLTLELPQDVSTLQSVNAQFGLEIINPLSNPEQ